MSRMGCFITFEGLDGAGKSTQITRVKTRLEEAGHSVLLTREPGGTATGDAIRALLLNPESKVEAMTEVLLYAASRAQLVREVIRPALAEGRMVLCDRFVDASLAYQGAGLALGVDTVAKVNAFATDGLAPDLTFLFDLPVDESRERVQYSRKDSAPDRIERRSTAYFDVVRNAFLDLARQHQARFRVLDATKTQDDLEQEIWTIIANYLETVTA